MKNDLIFKEKFTFPTDNKEKDLIYKIYLISNPKSPLGEVNVPLSILNVNNEEITSKFSFYDENLEDIALFKPRIIVVTSYLDTYQKQADKIEENIESYQSRIAQLNETLDEISLPYKKQFDNLNARMQKHEEERIKKNEFVNNDKGIIKGTLGKQEDNKKYINQINELKKTIIRRKRK